MAGRGWRDHSPAEGAGLDLRNFGIPPSRNQHYRFIVRMSNTSRCVGWQLEGYFNLHMTQSFPDPPYGFSTEVSIACMLLTRMAGNCSGVV